MLTRSHSNTEVKGEICFHIKIYLSYDFFQKSSCWLKNIRWHECEKHSILEITIFKISKQVRHTMKKDVIFPSCHKRDTREKVPFSESNLKTSDSRSNRRVWVETKGWIPPENSGSFLCSTLVTWRKKTHLPNSSAGSRIHQISYTSAIILFLWGLIYYQRFPARITKTPGFVDNFQWFHVQLKLRRRWW